MTFIHALVQEHPVPGVMKFTILVDTTLVILTINLIFCKHKTKEEDFFKEIRQFNTFFLKIPLG